MSTGPSPPSTSPSTRDESAELKECPCWALLPSEFSHQRSGGGPSAPPPTPPPLDRSTPRLAGEDIPPSETTLISALKLTDSPAGRPLFEAPPSHQTILHQQSVAASPEPAERPAACPGAAVRSQNPALPPDSSPCWSHLELQPECDAASNLMLCAVCLSGIVSLSVVVQQPSALLFIGLLLVMCRL